MLDSPSDSNFVYQAPTRGVGTFWFGLVKGTLLKGSVSDFKGWQPTKHRLFRKPILLDHWIALLHQYLCAATGILYYTYCYMYKNIIILFGIIFIIACSPNNVTVDNSIEKYFKQYNVTGTFGMFDNGKGKFTIYNVPRFRDSVYVPASTFKIVNAMIGLETGRVKDDSVVIPWDGIERQEPWNNDLKM